jgi:DNA-binding response OmpR family regulator
MVIISAEGTYGFILDVMMPIMSGDQMVREIRSHAELDAVPIMLLTAKADDSTKYNLLQGGVQEYLSKPFKAEVRRLKYIAIRLASRIWFRLENNLCGHKRPYDHYHDEIFFPCLYNILPFKL